MFDGAQTGNRIEGGMCPWCPSASYAYDKHVSYRPWNPNCLCQVFGFPESVTFPNCHFRHSLYTWLVKQYQKMLDKVLHNQSDH